MSITKRVFATLPDGKEVTAWTLTNKNGLQAEILDYGATIRSILVPDRQGKMVDVALGYDTIEEYLSNDGYLGATIGRFANRIKGATFDLNGETYPLCANNGENHLHGGKCGFDRYIWDVEQSDDGLKFSRLSPDGEEGYPGNLKITVSMGWEGNSLMIRYDATTDRDTVINFTNHCYFNLNGKGNILGHQMEISSLEYTENGPDCAPTGRILPVDGSAMDFRTPKTICRDIFSDDPSVKYFGGYDSNFVLHSHPVAITVGDLSGITMITDSDQPGLQLYTGNVLTRRRGKGGADYDIHSAFCLETQHFPDSIHHPQWPSCILRAGERFRSFTSYTFPTAGKE